MDSESEFEDEDEGEEGDNSDEVGEEEDTNEAEEEGEDEDAADDGDSDVVRCVVTYLSLPLALLRYFFILHRDSLTWMSCLYRRRPTANTDRALSRVAPQNQAQAPHSDADPRMPVCSEGKRSRQSRWVSRRRRSAPQWYQTSSNYASGRPRKRSKVF